MEGSTPADTHNIMVKKSCTSLRSVSIHVYAHVTHIMCYYLQARVLRLPVRLGGGEVEGSADYTHALMVNMYTSKM